MSFKGIVFIPNVEKFCQLYEEAKRFAQTHTGHGQLLCLKKREEDGNIKWISRKLVLRMRNGWNWRAVVLSDPVLYCLVRLPVSSGPSLLLRVPSVEMRVCYCLNNSTRRAMYVIRNIESRVRVTIFAMKKQ